jgi:DNA ligase (NAD+)
MAASTNPATGATVTTTDTPRDPRSGATDHDAENITPDDLERFRSLADGTGAVSGAELDTAVDVLTTAAAAYYHSDTVIVDDATYDGVLRRVAASDLSGLDPECAERAAGLVGAVAGGTSAGGDVAHRSAMLSLDNAMNAEETAAWHERLVRLVGDVSLVVEPKLDGLAAACHYRAGRLVQVVTRGDGRSGEDVTERARGARGLPDTLTGPDGAIWEIDLEVRGEIYLAGDDFDAANAARAALGKAMYVNRRNGAAGALRNASATYARLSFAAYALGEGGGAALSAESHSEAMATLRAAGAATAGSLVGQGTRLEGLQAALEAIDAIEAGRTELSFDIDGAVVKADRYADQQAAGATSRAPRWAIARKYAPDNRQTVLRAISVDVGRTGNLSFTAELDPVFVGGATVSRATLHNVEDLRRRIGTDGTVTLPARVWVHRAGDVIPEVVGLAPSGEDLGSVSPWEAPEACPRCGGGLDTGDKIWRCTEGRNCNLVANLTYACGRDALDVEGLSHKAISRLVDAGHVADLADLWALDAATLAGIDRMGEVSAAKIITNLSGATSAALSRVLTALGIRNVGRRPSLWVARAAGSMTALRAMSVDELAAIDGIGPTRAESLVAGLEAMADVIDRLVAAGFTMTEQSEAPSGQGPLAGKTVVVSGTVSGMTRDEARVAVERLGGTSSGSVSAKTDLLVAGPGAGSKLAKAEKLGVAVMDADDFAALANAAN